MNRKFIPLQAFRTQMEFKRKYVGEESKFFIFLEGQHCPPQKNAVKNDFLTSNLDNEICNNRENGHIFYCRS